MSKNYSNIFLSIHYKHKRTILRALRKLKVPKKDREDCLQNIYLSIYKSYDRFDPARGLFCKWLNSIILHEAAHYHDSAYNRKTIIQNPEKLARHYFLDLEEDMDIKRKLDRLSSASFSVYEAQIFCALFEGKQIKDIAQEQKVAYSSCARHVHHLILRIQNI